MRLVVIESGGPEELPGLQHADRQRRVGHLYLSGEQNPQTAAKLMGLIDRLRRPKVLRRHIRQSEYPAEQRFAGPSKKGAAAQKQKFLRR